MSIMLWVTVGFGLMFDKGQKQSSTLSCDSSYSLLKMCINGENTLNSTTSSRNRHSMKLKTIRKLQKVSLIMIGVILVVFKSLSSLLLKF